MMRRRRSPKTQNSLDNDFYMPYIPPKAHKERRIILFLLILFLVVAGVGFVAYYIESKYTFSRKLPITSKFSAFPGKKEIDILLLGIDSDIQPSRTDTMILCRISLKKLRAGILSIPRDSQVEIPGKGWDKINHAYSLGGIELTKETVENFLEIPIDYYILINLAGFKNMVELLGGVEIEVEKRMYYVDKAGGLYINLYPGKQILDSENAMGYVRFRHDAEGDIGRIRRQQKFLEAVAKTMLELENVGKIPEIIKEAFGNVETNLNLSQMMKLGNHLRKMELEEVVKFTVPGRPVMIKGISYWKPYKEKAKRMVDHLLKGKEFAENLQIKIEVLNGSQIGGAAKRVAERLQENGFQIVRVAKAPNNNYLQTEVISLKDGNSQIEERLYRILGITKMVKETKNLTRRYDPDFIIIVGEDLAHR